MKPQTNPSYDQIYADCVKPVNVDSPEAIRTEEEKRGITHSKIGEVWFKKLNPNTFSNYLRTRFTSVFCEPDSFIWSKKGLYVKFSEEWLKKICFAILMEVKAEDVWNPKLEREYIGALKLKSTFTHAMNIDRTYINLANGMFNIDSMEELDGIFLWAMEGLKRLKDQGYVLSRSEVCEKALADYKLDHNPMPQFIEMFILNATPNTDTKTLRSEFRPVFEKWLAANDRENRITGKAFWNTFNSELARQGKPKTDVREVNGKDYICNYKLNAAAVEKLGTIANPDTDNKK